MNIARAIAVAALGFLGLSSVIGAAPLILYPSGEPWGMPQSVLDPSPFDSFLIPGLVLLVANGVMGLSAFIAVLRKDPGYGKWAALQGVILAGWLIAEVVLLRTALWETYLYGCISVALVITGIALRRQSRPA